MHNFNYVSDPPPIDNPNFVGKLSTGFINETNKQTWLYGTGWVLPEEFESIEDMPYRS
jgi:hypothetical protein